MKNLKSVESVAQHLADQIHLTTKAIAALPTGPEQDKLLDALQAMRAASMALTTFQFHAQTVALKLRDARDIKIEALAGAALAAAK